MTERITDIIDPVLVWNERGGRTEGVMCERRVARMAATIHGWRIQEIDPVLKTERIVDDNRLRP